MGVVYRARDLKLGREVALKVLPQELVGDPERRRRFDLEARAVATLKHPNIITVYSVEESEGVCFITMEYIEGSTLSSEIVDGGMPVGQMLDVAIDVSDALSSAHTKGIVHRDLKPANVMRDADGRIKILDFGLARVRQEPPSGSGESKTEARSSAGVVVGTIPYMSPEQLSGRALDHRSDIFSLGVMLFEMATGRRPFQGDSSAELISSILRDDPSRALRETTSVPSPLAGIIERCLEKDPDRRFQSCGELRRELERFRVDFSSGRANAATPSAPDATLDAKSGVTTLPRSRGGIVIATLIVAIAAIVGAIWFTRGRPASPPAANRASAPIRSLAVLPFENLSGDAAQDYFSDGFTDELTTTLSRVSALKVIARTSTARYKGATATASEIGNALGVEGLITGSVIRAGDRVRISVQLVSAGDDSNRWAESYERDTGNVLALQAEVARAIADAIAVQLSASETASLASPAAIDPRAVDAYLRGRALWNQRTESSVRDALQQFESAAQVAPAFALGHAGVADSHIILAVYGFDAPHEGFAAAKSAASRALALDPSLGEPHASLGDIAFHYDWDWERSDRELRQAIKLSPGLATAYHWHSEPLLLLDRNQEALESLRHARTLDPLSMVIRTALARTMALAGDRAGAERELRDAIALDSRFPGSRIELARLLLSGGRGEEALAEARRAVESNPSHVPAIATLGLTLAAAGNLEEARALLAGLDADAPRKFVSGLDRARIAAGLRDRDATLRYLESAVKAREGYMPFLQQYEEFAFVHDEPRYAAIVREVGLAPPSSQRP
jgi:serine/threonine protein kinase/tetratricopeptide (TPR) repeat protein